MKIKSELAGKLKRSLAQQLSAVVENENEENGHVTFRLGVRNSTLNEVLYPMVTRFFELLGYSILFHSSNHFTAQAANLPTFAVVMNNSSLRQACIWISVHPA